MKNKKTNILVWVLVIIIAAAAVVTYSNKSVVAPAPLPEIKIETPVTKPVVEAQPVLYKNTKSNYSLVIPVGTQTSIEDSKGKVYAKTLPDSAEQIFIEKGNLYFSVSDRGYPYGMGVTTKRTTGTIVVDGKTYRTSGWIEEGESLREMVYVRDDLVIYYGYNSLTSRATLDTFVKPILASLKIQ